MLRQENRLYFAYGANLNWRQMKERCSSPQVVGIAALPGYRLGFFGHSAMWDGAVDTLVPDQQATVWGVLYRLEFFDCDALDVYMDARLDGTGVYFHYPVEVVDEKKNPVKALLYKKDQLGQPQLPSKEYLDFIIRGAKEHGLPEEYIALLAQYESKPAGYAVPRRPKFDLGVLISDECRECEDLIAQNRAKNITK